MQHGRNDVPIQLSADGLKIILRHLRDNPRLIGAGNVNLSAQSVGGQTRLVITDDGPGISKGNKSRIFEPFFATKRSIGGTGMGLSILRNILSAHRGTIALNESINGACFVIGFHDR
ncbi:MAG: two-component system OmpR family sensor kinase [Paracoccaceae bacterium]